MFLGNNHISKLPNFITGYMLCDELSSESDFYFGERGFLNWYTNKYYNSKKINFWSDYFLAEAGNDEVKALELYFVRLEEYYAWYNETVISY